MTTEERWFELYGDSAINMKNKISKARRTLTGYEKEGYEYEDVDIEEFTYSDDETRESGQRVLVKISMKRPYPTGRIVVRR